MTMSVWEQRTSQLRRHRQMSSREVLQNSTGGEDAKDGDAAAATTPGGLPHPLSLHGKHNQSTPLGSLKRLAVADPLASPNPPPATDPHSPRDPTGPSGVAGPGLSPPDASSAGAADATSDPHDAASCPEPALTLAVPGPPESEPAEKGLFGPINGCRSPLRNGERRHRAVRKFRPPAAGDALTPEMAGHGALVRGRKGPAGGRGQGGHPSASRSVSRERRTRSGEEEEEEEEEKDGGGEKLAEGR